MNLGLVLGITIIFFGIIGGMIFAVTRQLKKVDSEALDTSTSDNIETAQEFLPFKNIRDGVIDMGGHDYRLVIECSSTNYNLKTDTEREMIELSFQKLLNSLTFPITMFIQTKVLDNTKILSQMEEEIKTVIKQHPQMEDYALNYFEEMSNLSDYIGNNKQKKKYIIVPYNEAATLGKLSEEEKYEYSIKELQQRGLILVDMLAGMGIKGTVLDTKGLAELVYSTYHKDNFGHYENVVNGEFLSLLVEGERNPEEGLSSDKRADWILYEAQMRFKTELLDKDIPEPLKEDYREIVKNIDKIRKEIVVE